MATLVSSSPYSFGLAPPPAPADYPPGRPRTPQRRVVLLSKRKQRRADQDALVASLKGLGLEDDDQEVEESRRVLNRDLVADAASLEAFLSCRAPVARPKARGAPSSRVGGETATTEALRGWYRCERTLRNGLQDAAAEAVERRLKDWLDDDRPLSPQRIMSPSGLRLRAPYGGNARGRLVVHAVARFHGCASKTLPDRDDLVLIERPRVYEHRLKHGARVRHALDFRSRPPTRTPPPRGMGASATPLTVEELRERRLDRLLASPRGP